VRCGVVASLETTQLGAWELQKCQLILQGCVVARFCLRAGDDSRILDRHVDGECLHWKPVERFTQCLLNCGFACIRIHFIEQYPSGHLVSNCQAADFFSVCLEKLLIIIIHPRRTCRTLEFNTIECLSVQLVKVLRRVRSAQVILLPHCGQETTTVRTLQSSETVYVGLPWANPGSLMLYSIESVLGLIVITPHHLFSRDWGVVIVGRI